MPHNPSPLTLALSLRERGLFNSDYARSDPSLKNGSSQTVASMLTRS